MPPTAAAYKRYLDKFDKQETEIESLQAKVKELQAAEHQAAIGVRGLPGQPQRRVTTLDWRRAPGEAVLPGPPGRYDTGTALPELPRLCQFPSLPTFKPQLAEICPYPVRANLRQLGPIGGDPCIWEGPNLRQFVAADFTPSRAREIPRLSRAPGERSIAIPTSPPVMPRVPR